MRARLTVGIVLALAAGMLGALVWKSETGRRAAEEQARQVRQEAERVRDRWQIEQRALESRLVAASSVKPLLAALDSHVDGTTMLDLFQTEDWWRQARADFSLSRIVVGRQALVTFGGPDPGTADREVVARARTSRVASDVVTLEGKPCFVIAARLFALTGRDPVLVAVKAVDTARLGVAPVVVEVPPRAVDVFVEAGATGLLGMLALILLGGAAFARPSVAGAVPVSVPVSAPIGETIAMGSRAPVALVPFGPISLPSATPSGNHDARLSVAPAWPRSSEPEVPAPRTMISTPGPVGPPREAALPEGTPDPEAPLRGTPFGRYQLLDRLGEGGMSEVFTAAAHGVEGFTRVFVLKRLRPELAKDKEAMGQFVDEARMQASLVHSNIVPVFDFGQVGNELFMTQEYIVGRDLVRLIARLYEHARQALTPRLAYYFAHETLLALQYAHTRCDREGHPLGIVHRDVSPANVIVSAQGEVKLSDFGIVKSNRRVSRTQAGMVKGNVNFMSPEQAKGKDVDARSDLFSMGLVLYYCLTNQFLYDGDNDLEVLFKAASGPSREQRERIEALPSPARELLGKALAVNPDDRFQTAAEFADTLLIHTGGAKAEAVKLMQKLFGEELLREAA